MDYHHADAAGLSLPPNARARIATMISGIPGTPATQATALREHIFSIKAAPLKTTNLLGKKQTGGNRRKMPYTMRRSRRGCQVARGRKTFSRRPIACARAERQMRLLRAIERGWKPSGSSRKTLRQRRK